MRCAYDVVDAGIVGGHQHLARFGRGTRTVVNAGKYVAVDIEHARFPFELLVRWASGGAGTRRSGSFGRAGRAA